MPLIDNQAARILKQPGAFALQVMRAFRANQGLLLAGAVAYYTLLSIVPLLILMVMGLSQVTDQRELLATLRHALEHLAPGQGKALMIELTAFMEHREVLGWVLLASLLFFSSLAFRVLENAISVIFLHRVATHQRNFLVSALLPLVYIAFIAAGLFIGTLALAQLIAIGETELRILGHAWSLGGISRFMLYLAGIVIEILVISAIYFFLSAGRISPSHALIGGATAGLLWEIIRQGLAWYLTTFSQVELVYGSLTTAIIVLLSLEIAATLLLLGAQVIAEYGRFGTAPADQPPVAMQTEAVKGHTGDTA
ncbi:MAG: YihY/virulence factor BrkB family protein [Burkholderiales bacterium]|nr:YihY/virulence factor BrkB family protein [Burkholderiales bacterium]